MAKDKPVKVASKKHLARLERERRQTRLITLIAIGLLAIIVGLIGYGILNDTYLKYLAPVVAVNDDSMSIREFQIRVRLVRQSYINQYLQYYQFAQMFGLDLTSDSSISQTLNQLQSLLDNPSQIGQQVIDDVQNEFIILQYAKENNIFVSEVEVEGKIREAFGYFPEGTPTPTPSAAPLSYPTWSATQYSLITPTSTPTLAPSRTPAPTATYNLTATATAIPSITPTATPYTLEGFESIYTEGLANYAKLGMNESQFRKILFEIPLYRQRVSALVAADVKHEQEQVWARHILVADNATAEVVRAQLMAGEDFGKLAAQYSTDTSNKDKGGDLGWFGKGVMAAEFENSAFSLQVGEISQPVNTTFGWHIIQVLGHEIRPLTDTEYKDAVSKAFDHWLTNQRNVSTIVVNDTWMDYVPDQPSLESAFNNIYATSTAIAEQQTPTP
jgi:peptidyl-prolyl cis-trans isomerase D